MVKKSPPPLEREKKKMSKQKRENRNTNLVALTGGAALLAIAVNFAVNALKKNHKKKDLPGSTVQVNLSPPEILRLANRIIAKSKEVHDSIASVPLDKVTYTTAILPLAELEAQQFPLVQSCVFPKLVSTSEDVRKASAEAERRIDAHGKPEDQPFGFVSVFLFYLLILLTSSLSNQIIPLKLWQVRDFERSGLSLTLTKREELQRLSAQIDELSGRYIRNLNDDSTSLLVSETELVGLPPEFLESLDKAENGKFKVTLRSHHVSPILELCKVQLRHKSAGLLGYSNYADYAVNHRMANSSSKVFEFLEELSASLTDLATRELSMLKDLKKKEEGDFPFGIEDLLYYVKRIEEQQFNLDVGALKQYFPFNLVMSGILKICQDLFGLRFEEIADAEVWHSDVHLYSVYDLSSSELLGYFYLDMFSRENMVTPVLWLFRMVLLSMVHERLQKEVGHTALLRFSEVDNLFHEFGHVIAFSTLNSLPDHIHKLSHSQVSWNKEGLHKTTASHLPLQKNERHMDDEAIADDFSFGSFFSRELCLRRVVEFALALQKAGCFSVVLECVLAPVDAAATFALRIPTIGIGVQLRHKSTRLLGYSNYADYAVNHRMANSFSKVSEFLEELSASLADLATRELSMLKDLKEGDFPFGIEDLLYYVKRIKEQQFNLDVGALKQYFPFNLVMSGILKTCPDLFGLRFEEIANAEVWHSDVHLYSIYDLSSSELLGYFYLDMFSREGKYGHTCVVALQNGSFVNGARKAIIPVALLTSHTALSRFSEMVNLFHEFGHVIDLRGVSWAVQALQQMGKLYKGGSFFSNYHSSSDVFCLQKYANGKGAFIDLSKWEGGVKKCNIIIPAGNNGSGWMDTPTMLRKVICNEPKRNTIGMDVGVRVTEGVQSKGTKEEAWERKTRVNRGRQFVDLFTKNRTGNLRADMERAVVRVRCDFSSSWAQIEKELSKYLKKSIAFRPSQINRALFWVSNREEANLIGNKGLRFFNKGVAISLEKWSEVKYVKPEVIVSYGGWITVCDLLFTLWNEKIFHYIGKKCGGLLEVDRRTVSLENLFEVRLKVRGFDSGFLPVCMEIKEGDRSSMVRLKPLSKSVRHNGEVWPTIFRQQFSGESFVGDEEDERDG
ncbi:unnamed protein product [Camellia sinensis]